MAAVPSTIGPAAYRRPVHETERRLRVVTGAEGLPGRNPLPGRAPAGVSARRRLATLAAVVGLVGLWFGTGALASGERLAPRPTLRVTAGTVYVVGGGDSLASIARRISPPDEVPAVVRVLRSELHGHPLRAGMVLRVP